MSEVNELDERRAALAARISQSIPNPQITASVNSIEDMSRQIIDGLDAAELKKSADKEAKDFVQSVAEYYLTEDSRKKNMIKKKIKADISNIASIIYTQKINEHGMAKCLQQVDVGTAPPGTFQVLAKLIEQSTIVSKHQSQERALMTDTYRVLKSEASMIIIEHENPIQYKDEGTKNKDGSVRTRGSKQLVEKLKQDKIESGTPEPGPTDEIRLTNPLSRPTPVGIELPKEVIEDVSEMDLDDDIFNN